jgi:ADP-ribose pyrophosphatase YjhB (NUDIX family)
MSKTPNDDYPMTLEEFHDVYSKVPRLTVEVVLKSDRGVLLSLRDIEPYKGFWHLPGGTVLMGEKLIDAASRVARRELGVKITSAKFLDYIEYPEHYAQNGQSVVGLAFLAEYHGELQPNEEASKLEWFSEVPEKMHPEQGEFINSKVL